MIQADGREELVFYASAEDRFRSLDEKAVICFFSDGAGAVKGLVEERDGTILVARKRGD